MAIFIWFHSHQLRHFPHSCKEAIIWLAHKSCKWYNGMPIHVEQELSLCSLLVVNGVKSIYCYSQVFLAVLIKQYIHHLRFSINNTIYQNKNLNKCCIMGGKWHGGPIRFFLRFFMLSKMIFSTMKMPLLSILSGLKCVWELGAIGFACKI